MKWVPYLLAIVVGFLLCLLLKPDPTTQGQAWLDSLNVERERSRVLALDSLQREHQLAAVGIRVARQEAELAQLRRIGQQTSQQLADARRIAQEAQADLGAAQTMADSFPRLIVSLEAEKVRAQQAENLVANRDAQILAGAVLLAAVRDSVVLVTDQRDVAREDARRWRRLAEAAEPVIARPNRYGRAAETLAIGAATVGACRDGLLSVGCLSGAIVTTMRLK